VLLTGPAAPRQPTRLFYSVTLSEAKDLSARPRPFRLSQKLSPHSYSWQCWSPYIAV